MKTPKNTMIRDENGNVREGVKWYLELNDILTRFFGNECGYSRGFQRVVVGKHGYTGSVFELNDDKHPTPEFLDYIKNYSSEHIKRIMYQKKVIRDGKILYKNAVIVLV